MDRSIGDPPWIRVVFVSILMYWSSAYAAPIGVIDAETLQRISPRPATNTGTTSGNQAPGISGVPVVRIPAGSNYRFVPVATDPDGDTLTFSIQNLPAWAFFSSQTGELYGARKFTFDGWVQRPTINDIGVTTGIVISVSDGHSTVSLPPFNIEVYDPNAIVANNNATDTSSSGGPSDDTSQTTNTSTSTNPPANKAPVISGIPATTISAGSFYQFQPTATDADGDTLTFSIQNQPSWTFFSSQTGELYSARKFTFDGWVQRPTTDDIGTTTGIVISVSDGKTTSSLPPFNIKVTN